MGDHAFTDLIGFFEEATKKVDEDKVIDIVYMDFSKALDKGSTK